MSGPNGFESPALPCGATATAPRRPGLHASVNARGGGDKDLAKSGNVAPSLLGRIGLLSRRIRDAFAAAEAEDPAGDYPPASDCWPMAALNDEALVVHAPDYVAGPTLLSPGKSPAFTGTASVGGC